MSSNFNSAAHGSSNSSLSETEELKKQMDLKFQKEMKRFIKAIEKRALKEPSPEEYERLQRLNGDL